MWNSFIWRVSFVPLLSNIQRGFLDHFFFLGGFLLFLFLLLFGVFFSHTHTHSRSFNLFHLFFACLEGVFLRCSLLTCKLIRHHLIIISALFTGMHLLRFLLLPLSPFLNPSFGLLFLCVVCQSSCLLFLISFLPSLPYLSALRNKLHLSFLYNPLLTLSLLLSYSYRILSHGFFRN